MKWIGAFLVMFASLFCGFRAAQNLSRRVQRLRSLRSAIGDIRAEISFSYKPLPDICRALAARYADLETLFAPCAATLTGDTNFRDIWCAAAEKNFAGEEKNALRDLGQSLGRYDAQSQISALNLAESRLDDILSRAEPERERKTKLYAALGLSAGAAAVVLII